MAQPIRTGNRERDILYRVIQIASSALRTDTILRSVVEVVSEALDCDTCFVYLWEPDDEVLVLRAAPPSHAAAVGVVKLGLGQSVDGWSAQHRRATGSLMTSSVEADGTTELGGQSFPAMLSVPIFSRDGSLLGAINVHAPHEGRFSEDDLRFLEHTASLVAGAIENAQLYQIAKRKEEALAALVRETIQVQEEERRRVATEIHDGVTQQLVSIWFRVHACQRRLERRSIPQALEEIEQTKRAIDETLAEARNAIYNLRPATLDDLGLVAALHEFTARFSSESGVEARVVGPDVLRLSPHVETALFRIAQEAMTNVRKHARATSVTVTLERANGMVTLSVADDGAGFDVEEYTRTRPKTSFGLAGMRERVELIRGRLTLQSGADHGTTLSVKVPVEESSGVA